MQIDKVSLPVILISILFIAAGLIGFIYHIKDFSTADPFAYDSFWIQVIRLLAAIGGVAVLIRKSWGRWILLGWIAFHTGLSIFHTLPQLIIHVVLLAVVVYFLFRSKAKEYFKIADRKV